MNGRGTGYCDHQSGRPVLGACDLHLGLRIHQQRAGGHPDNRKRGQGILDLEARHQEAGDGDGGRNAYARTIVGQRQCILHYSVAPQQGSPALTRRREQWYDE